MVDSTIRPIAYRISAACAVAGIGRTRLYQLIAEGKIKARACGGRTLILAKSLHDFIESLPPAPIASRLNQ